MISTVNASTRVFALLGDPIDHSLSPVVQNTGFREAECDGVYVALRCDQEDMVSFIRGLAKADGGGNITLPHKERAVSVVDQATEAVRRTGACNTFWGEDGRVFGDNTDVEGLRRALNEFLGGPPEGARVLLLGAGGAARGALVTLLDDGVDEVSLFNRTVERARAVSRRIGGERVRVHERLAEIDGEDFDLVINATQLGLNVDDVLPMDLATLGRVGSVVDLVYKPTETLFVREARKRGIRACDGGEMLVQQGAAAFELWWDRPAPLEAMRTALEQVREQ